MRLGGGVVKVIMQLIRFILYTITFTSAIPLLLISFCAKHFGFWIIIDLVFFFSFVFTWQWSWCHIQLAQRKGEKNNSNQIGIYIMSNESSAYRSFNISDVGTQHAFTSTVLCMRYGWHDHQHNDLASVVTFFRCHSPFQNAFNRFTCGMFCNWHTHIRFALSFLYHQKAKALCCVVHLFLWNVLVYHTDCHQFQIHKHLGERKH